MDGRAVRKDPGRQPFESPPAANGTGGVHTGTPRSLTSDVSGRSKLKNNMHLREDRNYNRVEFINQCHA
jgi:hypothetical protein